MRATQFSDIRLPVDVKSPAFVNTLETKLSRIINKIAEHSDFVSMASSVLTKDINPKSNKEEMRMMRDEAEEYAMLLGGI